MTIPSPVSLRFQGYKTRSRMGNLAQLKPGDMAVCRTLTPANKGDVETSELVQIVSIEPHQGKTVNGIRVERDPGRPGMDEVDLVTYRILRSRDRDKHGKECSMLYGEYVSNSPAIGITNTNQFDPDGKPMVSFPQTKNPEPTRIIELTDLETYIQGAVKARNWLTGQLPQNQTFRQRLRNLFKRSQE